MSCVESLKVKKVRTRGGTDADESDDDEDYGAFAKIKDSATFIQCSSWAMKTVDSNRSFETGQQIVVGSFVSVLCVICTVFS